MVLATGSCGPTPVLRVHGINKKSGSLCLKNRFSSWFSVFKIRPLGSVRVGKPCQSVVGLARPEHCGIP